MERAWICEAKLIRHVGHGMRLEKALSELQADLVENLQEVDAMARKPSA